MKRILSMLFTVLILSSAFTSVASACYFLRDKDNIQTNCYNDAVLTNVYYSWDNTNYHPTLLINEENTYNGKRRTHYGYINKISTTVHEPQGTIHASGPSFVYVTYTGTYYGWVDCVIHEN